MLSFAMQRDRESGRVGATASLQKRENKIREGTWIGTLGKGGGAGEMCEQRHKIKTAFCNTVVFLCVRARMCLFSVCVSIKCKRLKPRDKCMKCYCG